MKQRLLDPSNLKRSLAKDEALRRVINGKFGSYKNYKTADSENLRKAVNPMYKSIERHEERGIKKGGKKSIRNMKGKIGYFKHLDARAKRRGEEDL